ncbi:hypothetical protein ACEWY4_027875 [Coilia grayii]|uniref:Hexosyltransferase n=1 Tax=Coilia grayii TaxID=363190 RepID=A0ABD1INE6_9TELE
MDALGQIRGGGDAACGFDSTVPVQSDPVGLRGLRRYYFEILHKQDDRGSDHVEVGWRPFLPGLKYEIIDSAYISLYTDESSLKMNSVDHVPQTLASHARLPQQEPAPSSQHGADMLKADPRDTFYSLPMIEASRLENVLPACLYSPTYVVKDFPIARYQGLQFVYLSFVYPNDFTRLTHMERENKCFYRESPIYLEKFGFYKYMKMDEEDDDQPLFFPNPDGVLPGGGRGGDPEDEVEAVGTQASRASQASTRRGTGVATPAERREEKGQGQGQEKEEEKEEEVEAEEQQQEQEEEENNNVPKELEAGEEIEEEAVRSGRRLSWIRTGPEEPGRKGQRPREPGPKLSKSALLFPQKSSLSALTSRAKQILTNSAHAVPRSPADTHPRTKEHKRDPNKIYITRPRPAKDRKAPLSRQPREVFPGVFLYQTGKHHQAGQPGRQRPGVGLSCPSPHLRHPRQPLQAGRAVTARARQQGGGVESHRQQKSHTRERPKCCHTPPCHTSTPSHHHRPQAPHPTPPGTPAPSKPASPPTCARPRSQSPRNTSGRRGRSSRTREEEEQEQEPQPEPDPEQQDQDQEQDRDQERDQEQGQGTVPEEEGGLSEYSYEDAEPRPGWAEESINWQRTFSVNTMDFELLRSDWNDLRCNVSGNLQLAESEVVDVLAQYMEKLNERNGGIYTLLRIINVEKRRDSARGNRYLVELELMERGRSVVRLSEYIYMLLHRGRSEDSLETGEALTPPPAPTPVPVPVTTPANAKKPAPSARQPSPTARAGRGTPQRAPPPPNPCCASRSCCSGGETSWCTLWCQVQAHVTKLTVVLTLLISSICCSISNQGHHLTRLAGCSSSSRTWSTCHRETKDDNFNIIIVDFQSDDMDVEQALRESTVPRYEYLRRPGNFERSAGLQIGVDTIEDSHSIVFLCDLHIHFPLNILESIRKHCVEGRLALCPHRHETGLWQLPTRA